MTETDGRHTPPPPQRRVPPLITIPPPSSLDTFLSPGPMTFVSNFFSDHYPHTDLRSFSQLLDGTLPSPNPPPPLLYHDSSSICRNKRNRPMDLISPTGFLSPVLSPLRMSHQQELLHIQNAAEESRTSQTSYLEDYQIESPENVSISQSDDSKPEPIVVSVTKPASDGYNWKKYGQKQVKASELPRSYHRCVQVNCPVTKKTGHSLDGRISEIIYKGQHNHEPPLVCKRTKDGAAMDKPADADEQVNHLEVAGDAPNRKIRKSEVGWCRVVVAEPKIVVQTRSEVDILDDGFKWRKYGQKVVKGNIYPRSYYRCTNVGCKVRKHVERALSDPKSVVTTYEGKHEHDIPVVAKHSIDNKTNFKAKRPILLQLKEEQFVV